jgi:cytochrome b6-f complex iron-sulfur subunit
MKNSTSPHSQDAHEQVAAQLKQQDDQQDDAPRRRFLKGAAGIAGGLALGLQLSSRADDATGAASPPVETLVTVPEKVLAKVGGFDVIETAQGKIIVARTSDASVAACSAVCTHKGCTVGYEHASKEFVCPCHGARFGLDGKVHQGPAKRDLKSYDARLALGLSEKKAG